MRGTKAKELRRLIYGDQATKSETRKYRIVGGTRIEADPLRRAYQRAKGRGV